MKCSNPLLLMLLAAGVLLVLITGDWRRAAETRAAQAEADFYEARTLMTKPPRSKLPLAISGAKVSQNNGISKFEVASAPASATLTSLIGHPVRSLKAQRTGPDSIHLEAEVVQ